MITVVNTHLDERNAANRWQSIEQLLEIYRYAIEHPVTAHR